MNEREPKSYALYVRVTPDVKRKFMEAAARYGTPSEVLRELVLALIDGRVTVSPPETVKESLYNVTRNET